MDIILNHKINLDDYYNNLFIVTGNFVRGGDPFHNKDWDYMYIAQGNIFKLWIYNLIKYYFQYTIKDNNFVYNNIPLIESIDNIKYKNLIKKMNLNGEWNELLYEHSLLSYMIENGIEPMLSDTQDIEATIIR
jgi:hypothetical protein